MTGIVIGLIILMALTYFGMSIIWVAPLAALVVALSGSLDILTSYTTNYMGGFGKYVVAWFPIFALGALFGKLMEYSGGAKSIASWLSGLIGHKRALLAVVVACAFLTYGGISLFVVVFVMYPMGLALFREANITRRLLPGAISLGAFTFTMTSIPGTPQIQNLIPMQYFGTTQTAAPTLSIVGASIMFIMGMSWLYYRARILSNAGYIFTEPVSSSQSDEKDEKMPHWLISILPPIAIIVLFNFFNVHIIAALLGGVLLTIFLFINKFGSLSNFIKVINEGVMSSLLPIINTSAAVGFGTVVREVPAFKNLSESMLNLGGSPLISEGIAVTVLAGATGSASGGLGIALEALGQKYLDIATSVGINPEVLHRVASIASGGLDTLPHNGAVLTLLAVCAMSHKESYLDIFVCCTFIPIISLAAVVALGSFGVV